MSNPSPRFTGIFLPAEILAIPELTLFETILLSWIDALYCPEHKGCYASNEYLGKAIKGTRENTVAKALSNLRKLGLIENVSFDGRTRVIRALIDRYVDRVKSKAGLDKNPIAIGQKSNAELDKNPSGVPPCQYLYDSKDNRKERERKSAPARTSSSEKTKERAPNVFLSDSEHDKLIAVYAAQKTAALYRILSEWKEDTPKSKWKKNDYRSILRWVVQAESERFQKGISSSENNSSLANTVIKKFSYRMDIQFSEHNGKKYMEFIKGAHSKIIYLDDIDFEEKVLKELKDRDLKMETQ